MCLHTFLFFFFNDTATTEIYTLSLHDALPICSTAISLCPSGPGTRWRWTPPSAGESSGRRRSTSPSDRERKIGPSGPSTTPYGTVLGLWELVAVRFSVRGDGTVPRCDRPCALFF